MYNRLYPLNSFSSEKKYDVIISEELSDNENEAEGPANIVLYSGMAISETPVVTSGVSGYEQEAKHETPGTKMFFAEGII